MWLRNMQNLLKQGSDGAEMVLNRALVSLPCHKHIKFISRAAFLEYKIGSAERARLLFEGVLRNYPKRTDLWSVYLDQVECKVHHVLFYEKNSFLEDIFQKFNLRCILTVGYPM